MGSPDTKVGITGSPIERLGTYQNSVSRNSHVFGFDKAWWGPAQAVSGLERLVIQELNWEIQRDGRGHSEWVYLPWQQVAEHVGQLILGGGFLLQPVPDQFLPLTVDNYHRWEEPFR